ncbi:hypothetical protein C8R47DRAFT_1221023 [Mycena vitilis]|nr:hypothetical protein C8R47DRAFT_1221023 [Mycena vitilis]
MASPEHQLVAFSLDDSRSPSPASSLSSSSASTEYFSDNEPSTPPPSPPPSLARHRAPAQHHHPLGLCCSRRRLQDFTALDRPATKHSRRIGLPLPIHHHVVLTSHFHRAEAAHATVGRREGTVHRVSPSPRQPKKTKVYAVFFGITPGWYPGWDVAQPLVSGVHGSVFLSYPSELTARAAFEYAQSKSWTGVCSDRSVPYEAVPHHELPTPATEPLTPLHCGTWYIVYKGIAPGVYQSFLECALNTVGICGSTYDSARDKNAALASFARSMARGDTARLVVPHVSHAL